MGDKSGRFLTVNTEDFATSPVVRKRHITRKKYTGSEDERAPSPAVSFDESLLAADVASSTEDLRPASATSLYSLNRANSIESLRKHRKSIDNSCFNRKKLHRQAQINEIYRPRFNTDPGLKDKKSLKALTIPILRIPEDEGAQARNIEEISTSSTDTTSSTPPIDRMPSPSFPYERKKSGSGGVLGSLIKQTLKVTTASMGFRAASMERLAPATFRPLNEDVKQRFSSCTSNSSASSCSNSSVASDTLKIIKSKDCARDVGNLKELEECNYLIAEEDEDEGEGEGDSDGHRNSCSLNKPCNIVITFNDAGQPLEQQKQQQQQQQEHEQHSVEKSTFKVTPALPSPSLYTIDSLAVLKEEDEKDFSSSSSSATNNNNPPPVITQQRSTSSVSTLAQLPTSSMAPLQTHTECQSVQCLNILDKDYTDSIAGLASYSPPQKTKKAFQHQLSIPESLQSASIGCATSSEYSSARSLKHSATSLTPLPTLNSSGSFRSISPSRRSASSNSSSTAKHEQSSAAATAAAAATATATTSNGSLSTTTPPEKEKKRKEISSSRVKKFHRHFSQVSKDEKLINYFSCALVSDILLQGHLYITDQHFAFYSNVFGYVTKVVIPTSSVTKISKEKTAKIIPNAVGVATADERHVFGSFISRESAFRLMCSVCPPLGVPEILPKDPASIEISEEYSIEDDSSCSISGNESPAQITELQNSSANGNLLHNDASQTLLRRSVGSSNLSIAEGTADKMRHSDIPISAKTATNAASTRSSAPAASNAQFVNGTGGGSVCLLGLKTVISPAATTPAPESEAKLTLIAGCASSTTSATSTPTPSTSSSPTTVMTLPSSKINRVMNIFNVVSKKLMSHFKFPTEIHVVYLGVMLTLLLALFSIFLLYRILDIEAKTNGYRSPVEFNWRSGNDDDIFNEALRFQKQLQLKSTEEAQNILKTNLEQIAKVRRSLETLSMLIHDRSSSFVSTDTDDSD